MSYQPDGYQPEGYQPDGYDPELSDIVVTGDVRQRFQVKKPYFNEDAVDFTAFAPATKHPSETILVELDLFEWCANFIKAGEQADEGEDFRPPQPNGYAYRVTTAGQFGLRIPNFFPRTLGLTVQCGSVTLITVEAGANGLSAITAPSVYSNGITITGVAVRENCKIVAAYTGGAEDRDYEAVFAFTLNGVTRIARQKVLVRGPAIEGLTPAPPDGGAVLLDELQDVVISSPSAGQFLSFNGTNWVNTTAALVDGILTYYIKNGASISGLTIVTGSVDDAQADINRQAIQAFIDLADATEAQLFVSSEIFEIFGGPVIFRATAFGIKWRGQLSTTLRQRSNNVAVLQLGDTGAGGQVIGLDFDGATLHYLNDQAGNTGANMLVIGNQWLGKYRNIRCGNTITLARPYRNIYYQGGSSVFSCHGEDIYGWQPYQSFLDIENFGTGNVLTNCYFSGVGFSGVAQVVARPVEIRVGTGSQLHDSAISQLNIETLITNRMFYTANWRSFKIDSFHVEHVTLSGAGASFFYNEISTPVIDGLMFLDCRINTAEVTDSIPAIFKFFNDGITTVTGFTWVNNVSSNINMPYFISYQADSDGINSSSARLILNSPQFVDGVGTVVRANMRISRSVGGTDMDGAVWGNLSMRAATSIRVGGDRTFVQEPKLRIDSSLTLYGIQSVDAEAVVLVHAANITINMSDRLAPPISRWQNARIKDEEIMSFVVLGTSTGTTRVENHDGTEIFTHPTATATTRYNLRKSGGNWALA